MLVSSSSDVSPPLIAEPIPILPSILSVVFNAFLPNLSKES